ncbi:uncharacterized protein N7483_006817 [Penicillium malachiteum]|uniref:uncharacterized protein n=1 Tax=Penicillium malachiteum TaxID=1324776 RepID=UPI00254874F9|nr:uncharacterized protein N7483_006817 [Penicillium malachiteum]KAJ5725460.1 hypothetical protein N7483_006817 [Penicillium malachiteum]
MTELSWKEQEIDQFFERRQSTKQLECDEYAHKISGGSIEAVGVPGSLSYTVLCTDCPREPRNLIVSLREVWSTLDTAITQLAKSIHGDFVPEASFHGEMPNSNPSLLVYTMPYLQGITCLEAFGSKLEMKPEEKAKHLRFFKDLARYFARCWSSPQPVDFQVQNGTQEEIHRQLTKVKSTHFESVLPDATILELQRSLPVLFQQTYPQVLTHNDISQTNILVNEETFEITGLVDWSLAKVLPFGMELGTLILATGYMGIGEWHTYTCRQRLIDAFWAEFWAQCQIVDPIRQQEVRSIAMQGAKIASVLHYAFKRNADGTSSEELNITDWALRWLEVSTQDY